MFDDFQQTGRAWHRSVLEQDELSEFAAACDIRKGPGARIAWSETLGRIIGEQSRLCRLIRDYVPYASPVRIVSFNKTAETNWGVPWHQDRVVALAEREEVPGFSVWKRQGDFWHVEPPPDLLGNMVFARVFIDPCDKHNGAMEYAVGSHSAGRVPADRARTVAMTYNTEFEDAAPGDVLILKALTLHRSTSSAAATHRRAVRIDFAVRDRLDHRLRWALNPTG